MVERTRKEIVSRVTGKRAGSNPLLVYVKDTKVGSRKGAMEKTLE